MVTKNACCKLMVICNVANCVHDYVSALSASCYSQPCCFWPFFCAGNTARQRTSLMLTCLLLLLKLIISIEGRRAGNSRDGKMSWKYIRITITSSHNNCRSVSNASASSCLHITQSHMVEDTHDTSSSLNAQTFLQS